MSELYEGVIIVADEAAISRAFQSCPSPHALGFAAIRDVDAAALKQAFCYTFNRS